MGKKVIQSKAIESIQRLLSKAEWIKETDGPVTSLLFNEITHYKNLENEIEMFQADNDMKKYTEFIRLRNVSLKNLIALLRELGFTPKSRKEIQALISKKDEGDELEELFKGI